MNFPNNTFRFTAEYCDDEGNMTLDLNHEVSLEDAHISEVLYAFKSFLQAAGYNYITEVYAVKNDGEQVGEE